MFESCKYEDLPVDMEEATKLMSQEHDRDEFSERQSHKMLASRIQRLTIMLWLNITLFFLLIVIATSALTQRLRYRPLDVFFSADGDHFESKQEEVNHAWKQANSYSPLVDEISIPFTETSMKGTLIDYSHDIFRASPSNKTDAAWDHLTEHGWAMIPESAARKMGWDLSVTAKIPPALAPAGSSEPLYAGETDMIHKLHCLNMVRKDLIGNFPYYWGEKYPDGVPSETHQVHTNHCLYILLQALLCDANTDLIPSVYMDGYPHAVPDFEIQRKCGNWEGVKEWEESHRIMWNDTTSVLMMKPEGHKGRPLTDEFRRLFKLDS